jgi:hypothetical protein
MKPCPPGKERNPVTKRCRKAKPSSPRHGPASPATSAALKIKAVDITSKQQTTLEETIANKTKNSPKVQAHKVYRVVAKALGRTASSASGFIRGIVMLPAMQNTLFVFVLVVGGVIFLRYVDHYDKYHTDEVYRTVIDLQHYLRRNPLSRHWDSYLFKFFKKPLFLSFYGPLKPGECPIKYPSVIEKEVLEFLRKRGCLPPSIPQSWLSPRKLLSAIPTSWLK